MKLFPPQQEFVDYGFLETSINTLINIPTGSGKTYMAEMAINNTINCGYKAIYLVPLKALANEKYTDFQNRFNVNIGLFIGDTISKFSNMTCKYNEAQILIMTPERLDACLRNWRGNWSWIPDVDLLVVDEFHLLNDNNRGSRLEGTLIRIQRINPFVKIIGLSATMSNVPELANWLNGVYYKSDWRNVPLNKKILSFNKTKDKTRIMIKEVKRCIKDDGQSLIFVNSRSRTQELTEYLKWEGISVSYHHAGLNQKERNIIENSYRNKEIKALVCTSTLEMGLNLPTRQVIVYDSYQYNGEGFESLPVYKYMQRAGRAGRYNLDSEGEAILLLPKWVDSKKYENEDCEPILSQLNNERFLIEQILIELSCGYCKNREELISDFLSNTLYKQQDNEIKINDIIDIMILSGMLIEDKDKIKPSKIGKLAIKFMFSPASILLIKDVYNVIDKPYLFDILLLATITDDCNPVLQINYEDIENLLDIIATIPSNILNNTLDQFLLITKNNISKRRLLSAIKMSAICYALINGKDKKYLSDIFDIYEADIDILKENVIRILDGMAAILKVLKNNDNQDISDKLCIRLSNMLYYELDNESVNLTFIPHIGGKTAKLLIDNGYKTVEIISNLNYEELSTIKGIGSRTAEFIIDSAKYILDRGDMIDYVESFEQNVKNEFKIISNDICFYRLKRSLELRIAIDEGDLFLVSGGREDHFVKIKENEYICDCMDYEKNHHNCKHILAVKRHLNNKDIINAIENIKEDINGSIKEVLSTLWFSAANTY